MLLLCRLIVGGFFALALLPPPAAAQYPNKPITVIVPFAAGGPTDVVTRLVGEHMSRTLGQPVIVENIGGAGGTIGMTRAVQAKPDGYTIAVGNMGTQSAAPALYPSLKYDPAASFAQIGIVNYTPQAIVAKKSTTAGSLKEFIDYLKVNHSKLTYGHAGVGSISHVAGLVFNARFGFKPTLVPYRGTGPAMQDLVAGRLDFLCDIAVTAVPNIKSGGVKALANLSAHRSPVLPDLPTAGERGLPSVEAYTWAALFAPKGTPAPIVAKLQAAAVAAMNRTGLREQFESVAATLVAPDRRSSEYLGRFVKSEFEKWGEAIRAGGALPK